MRRLICNTAVVLLLGTVPCVALAELRPGIPEAFHGRATGEAGESITASIAGVIVATTTISEGGRYGYTPNLFFIPDPAANRSGTTISFLIGTTSATEMALFKNGAITALDLTLPGRTFDEPTTSATTTATSTPQEGDASTTPIVIGTTTPASGGSSSSGGAGGLSPAQGGASVSIGGVGKSATPTHTAPAPTLANGPTPHPSVSAGHTPIVGREEEVTDISEEEQEGTQLPLAAAAVLADPGSWELLSLLFLYLAGAGFFAYALRHRLRRVGDSSAAPA